MGVWARVGGHFGQEAQKHETAGEVLGTWNVIRVGEGRVSQGQPTRIVMVKDPRWLLDIPLKFKVCLFGVFPQC